MIGIRRSLDLHGSLVNDDHEDDLRRVGDRSVPLQDLDAFEPLRRAEARRRLGDDVRARGGADGHAREAPHFIVARRDVAVDADVDDRFRRGLKRDQKNEREEGHAHLSAPRGCEPLS